VKRDADGKILPPTKPFLHQMKNMHLESRQPVQDENSNPNSTASDDDDSFEPRYARQPSPDENGHIPPHSLRMTWEKPRSMMEKVMKRSVGYPEAQVAPPSPPPLLPPGDDDATAAPPPSLLGTPSTAGPPPAVMGAPLRTRHPAAAETSDMVFADIDPQMEAQLSIAASDAEKNHLAVSKYGSLFKQKLGERVLLWNAANVRRNLKGFQMWPVCHIIDNKLLVGVKKPGLGERPGLLFFQKNDSIPIEHNDSSIPLSASGFSILIDVASQFRDWVFHVEKMSESLKEQGVEKANRDQFIQLMHQKPADVYLEDSIRLPPTACVADNMKNKPLLAGAAGSVKLSCFLNQKFGLAATIVLKFTECTDKMPDERVMFIQGMQFALFVEGIIPFIKQCDSILECAGQELIKEYGLDY